MLVKNGAAEKRPSNGLCSASIIVLLQKILVPITNDSAVRRALRLSKWNMAMMRGDEEKAIQILDMVRDINRSDQDYDRPMMVAAKLGLVSVVQYLLDRGAKVTCPENEYGEVDDEIPLHTAAEGGYYEIAKMLIEHGSPISPPPYGEEATPLYYAAVEGHLSVARLLLRYGASVWESEYDDPAFAIAATNNDAAMVKLFLKYGADPDMLGSNYETPLFYATRKGAVKTMKVLLEAGANVHW